MGVTPHTDVAAACEDAADRAYDRAVEQGEDAWLAEDLAAAAYWEARREHTTNTEEDADV